jgi:prevent-host-death family protein
MKTATVRALRNDYAKLLRRVATGEEIAISRRGRIVARLVPVTSGAGKVDWTRSAASALPRPGRPWSAAASARLREESQGPG